MTKGKANNYDVIIAGAGAAGLSLLWHILQHKESKKLKILIIDMDAKQANDRTWGYWSASPQAFDHLAKNQFDYAEFRSTGFSSKLSLSPYVYYVIQGEDFYNYLFEYIHSRPEVHFLQAEVSSYTQQADDKVTVLTSGGSFTTDYLFTSLFLNEALTEAAKTHTVLTQHFKGWVIESEDLDLGTNSFRMFDFNTPQEGSLRFFYLIPYSRTKALVEYTIFSENLLTTEEYERALVNYIQSELKIKNYTIVEQEWGQIPMTTYPFRQKSTRIIPIGSAAGASKPSTGYTFLRIQKEAKFLSEQLINGRLPKQYFKPSRFTVYDNALLEVLKNNGERGEEVFSQLFRNNSPERLLRFLSEDSNFLDELMIMASVPQGLFSKSLLNYYVLNRKRGK